MIPRDRWLAATWPFVLDQLPPAKPGEPEIVGKRRDGFEGFTTPVGGAGARAAGSGGDHLHHSPTGETQ